MMGAGKSTVGKRLAELTGRPFADTDVMLQMRFGRPVSSIFSVYGEQAFRDHETSILRSLQPQGAVLATGGGVVLRDANWIEMRRLGIVAFLDASPEMLEARLAASKRRRPLLERSDWRARLRLILEERRPFYERADVRLSIDSADMAQVALQLRELLEARP